VFDGTIEPDLPSHVATTFEDVCIEAVWVGVRRGEFDPYSQVGRWWHGRDDADVVALAPNDDWSLLAECKWTAEPVGHALVDDLRAKADSVRWGPDDRAERFTLFSKRGFVDGLEADLDGEWSLYDMDYLEALLAPGQ